MDFAGQRVTIMGLGRHGGGLGAARYLARRGAIITLTDVADEAQLGDSLRALAGVPIARTVLGRHDPCDFRHAEVLVVNPAVRPNHPLVDLARDAGARVTSEAELFLNACPCPIVGVTGTNGKSSTCAMLAEIYQAAGRRTWLGGNIGGSLLDDLSRIQADDIAVLELSSFQLFWLSASCRLPETAVVTNCTPNHLDWHGTWEHYAAAKQKLIAGPRSGGVVLNSRDPVVASWAARVECRLVEPWDDAAIPPLAVPGRHQRENAALAAAAAAASCPGEAIERGLATFRGLPHRLQFVAAKLGRRFYNDSKATTPAATLAALETFERPPWLLAGGYDKGIDLRPLCREVVRRARGAAFFGATRHQFADHARGADARFPCCAADTLAEALWWCVQRSGAGDAILLSPASASHDQFCDYAARGEAFAALVGALGGEGPHGAPPLVSSWAIR